MKRPSVGGIVRLAIAAGLTALVFWKSDPARIWDVASRARLTPLLVAVLLVIADRALMAYRWLVLLRPLPSSRRPPFTEVMRVFFVSTFVGTFLPASVGGDAVRAFALAKLDVPAADSVASVLMDRVLGVLSLLLMALASLFVVRSLASNALVQLSLLVTAAGCLVVGLLVFSDGAAALVRRAIEAIPMARGRRVGRALLESIQRYSTHHGALANVLIGSVGVQVLRVVQAYFLGRALGIPAGLVLYFAFIPLILLVMLLPVTINGLGTSQAAFVWFFGTAGVGRAEAFALSVLFVALGIVGNLPGGLLYAWRGISATPSRPSGPIAS